MPNVCVFVCVSVKIALTEVTIKSTDLTEAKSSRVSNVFFLTEVVLKVPRHGLNEGSK